MEDSLPKLVLLKEVEVPVQTIIVNNEVKQVTQPAYSICCPECGRVIYSFNPGINYIEAYGAIVDAKEELQKNFPYCNQCGSKLSFNFDIFDGEYEVVGETNE